MKWSEIKNKWYIEGLKLLAFGLIFAFAIEHFGLWGILYIWLFFFVYAVYKVYTNWDMIINLMRYIEVLLWGKPLDKEYWKKGELKKKKMAKFVWKKDKRLKQ